MNGEGMAIARNYDLYVTPEDNAEAILLQRARETTTSLHAIIFGFTDAVLGDIFIAKHNAGLLVGLVCDKTQAAGPKENALLHTLVDAGVPIIITESSYNLISHEKALICDVTTGFISDISRVCLGSYNFSSASAEHQNNHLIDTNDAGMTQRLWLKYQTAAAFGLAHPQWQIAANPQKAVDVTIPPPHGLTPPVPADIAATPVPPETPPPSPSA